MRADLYGWTSAQPFKGTEAERLSLSGMSDEEAADIVANAPETAENFFLVPKVVE